MSYYTYKTAKCFLWGQNISRAQYKTVTPEENSDARACVCTHCRREFADVLSSCCLCSSHTLHTLLTHSSHTHTHSLTHTLSHRLWPLSVILSCVNELPRRVQSQLAWPRPHRWRAPIRYQRVYKTFKKKNIYIYTSPTFFICSLDFIWSVLL